MPDIAMLHPISMQVIQSTMQRANSADAETSEQLPKQKSLWY